MEERVTITIDDQGKIEFDTQGFTGKVCENVAEKIMLDLGATVTKSERKSSFYEDGDNPVFVATES
jgi:hypothetical protein